MRTAIRIFVGLTLTGMAGLTLLVFVLANTTVSRTADGQATSFEFSFGDGASEVSNTSQTSATDSWNLGRQIRAGKHSIIYAENVSEEEAGLMRLFLEENPDWLTASHCFHLERSGAQLNVTFLVEELAVGTAEAATILRELESITEDSTFYGLDVVTRVCDYKLETIVSIDDRNPMQRNEMASGDFVDTGLLKIYWNNETVSSQQADALADFFEWNPGYLTEGQSWTVQLDRHDENLVLRILLSQEGLQSTDNLEICQSLESQLENETFENENVVIELCNMLVIPQKSVDSTRPAEITHYEAM